MARPLPLVQIAARTGISQIVWRGRSTLNNRRDMLNMKWPARDQFLALTVLAAMAGTLGHSMAYGKGNVGHQLTR